MSQIMYSDRNKEIHSHVWRTSEIERKKNLMYCISSTSPLVCRTNKINTNDASRLLALLKVGIYFAYPLSLADAWPLYAND